MSCRLRPLVKRNSPAIPRCSSHTTVRSCFAAPSSLMSQSLRCSHLPSLPPSTDKSHHLPNASGFCNPWPSFGHRGIGPFAILKARYGPSRPAFVPVPEDRGELVQIRKPDFATPKPSKDGRGRMKVTWIGHASFLIRCSPAAGSSERGINVLLDPVFSDRTSPFSFIGPKRYTPTPCTLEELCDSVLIDVVCISHNHYDHADVTTLRYLFERADKEGREMVCCVGLGNARWLTPLIPDLAGREQRIRVWEGDWWDRIEIGAGAGSKVGSASVSGSSSKEGLSLTSDPKDIATPETQHQDTSKAGVRITITPSQHASARSPLDRDCDLWCSYAVELPPYSDPHKPSTSSSTTRPGPTLFFAGDTAYRTTFSTPQKPDVEGLSPSSREAYPSCPAFAQIGQHIGPFDLALLPIGLTRPRAFMSNVHADARDSVCMHRDVRSKRSVGMHWGTVRGGISGQYEDVRIPPREWEESAGEAELTWRGTYREGRSTRIGKEVDESDADGEEDDWELGLMDIGESLMV